MILAIILPVHNHLEFTKLTLEELSKKIKTNDSDIFHRVLVDDGSVDGTYEWVTANHPEVHILKGDGNLWWSGAVNMGAKYALETLKADYVLLWNNDISFDEGYFNTLTEVLKRNDQRTITGSKIYVAGKPGLVWSMGGYFDPVSGHYDMYGYFKKDDATFGKVMEVDWLTGMGTIVPRLIIETIGYWDSEKFPQYHGDSDFTYRAKLKGFSVICHPGLKIYNSVENSGIGHSGSFRKLLVLMKDNRSKINFKRNLMFYRLYAKSYRAFIYFYWKYVGIFGGFFKWKVLEFVGIKKK
jgi:GT2 family glycosyltransferase